MRRLGGLLALVLIGTGCYHATIETGRTPGPQKIEKAWAASWIYGLVPPQTVSTAQQCPNGVARVSTQLSFPNQLVGFLTFGIFTPMEIIVTCAAAGTASTPVRPLALGESFADALREAVKQTRDTGGPVYMQTR
jgi:hypothetical protein